MPQASPLTLDFLESGAPEAPMVRLFGTEPTKFAALRDLADDLARAGSEHTLYRFDERDGVNSVRCALSLKASPKSLGISWYSSQPNFDWILTRDDWAIVAGLVEPFAQQPRVGPSQWLTGPQARHGLNFGTIGVLLSCAEDGRRVTPATNPA